MPAHLWQLDTTGVTSVFVTYPLELIRVRLAFQTEKQSFFETIKQIYRENHPALAASTSGSSRGAGAATATYPTSTPYLTARLPLVNHFIPFYRGFSITLLGMVPYAGVSFLTYGTLRRHLPTYYPALEKYKTVNDLFCGAIAGLVSQTSSYPFEVVRRRMQVGGLTARQGGQGVGITWRQAVAMIWREGKGKIGRGFYVGLSIGYIKVVPMTA